MVIIICTLLLVTVIAALMEMWIKVVMVTLMEMAIEITTTMPVVKVMPMLMVLAKAMLQ